MSWKVLLWLLAFHLGDVLASSSTAPSRPREPDPSRFSREVSQYEAQNEWWISPNGAASFLQRRIKCEDVAPEHTGFDVNNAGGFLKHASCDDLTSLCHNETIGDQIRTSCPAACFVCIPDGGGGGNGQGWDGEGGPCFNAINTGIRFRDGPRATCTDLINYCNHSTIGDFVMQACKEACGLCAIHQEGPYLDQYGNCADLQTHEEPTFSIQGTLAGCSDLTQFCQNHPDSYLIRHKCSLSCGVCGNYEETTTKAGEESDEVKIPGDAGGCDRRRRWGFCSTRRRRNI